MNTFNPLPHSDEVEEKDLSAGVEVIDEKINDILEDTDMIYTDIQIFENDKQKQTQKNEVEVFDFIDEEKKNIFYGSSNYGKKGSVSEIKEVKDVFDFYKREGLHEDVYLPMTNVAVRIYEFSNLDISVEDIIDYSDKDLSFRAQINMTGTQTRPFVELIFKNAEFLTSDSSNLTIQHFEMISAQDIPLLILAAAKLLDRIYKETNKTAGSQLISWKETCKKCNTIQSISFDINELLQSNYTKEMIAWANSNYDPNDTLEANIKRSHKMRAKGVKYKKAKGGVDTIYFLKDPDWIRSFTLDEIGYKHAIQKFSTHRILKTVVALEYWNIMTAREKLIHIHTYLNHPNYLDDIEREGFTRSEAEELKLDFNAELYLCRITKYWFSNRVLDNNNLTNGKPTEITTLDTTKLSIEDKIKMLKDLDNDTLMAIIDQIEVINKFGIQKISYKWTCGKCNEIEETEIDPIFLVFLVLQNGIKIEDEK